MEVRYGTASSESFRNKKFDVDVDAALQKYKVEHPKAQEVLRKFPVLTYLLGDVSTHPAGYKDSSSGTKPYWLVTEGSGMFALKNPEDAREWKGIFNHMVGAAGNAYFLAEKIAHASSAQKQQLVDLGYLQRSVNRIDPQKLRDHKLIDHAGRRQADERRRYGVKDVSHPSTHSELNTQMLLHNADADHFFQDHMKEEDHHYLLSRILQGKLRDIDYAILTYADWTFDQTPISIEARFKLLSKRNRATPHVLERLEAAGKQFEYDFCTVFGDTAVQELLDRGPYIWENELREAYAQTAGLRAADLFPKKP